jgi:acyl-CoA thioester hydrolase
MIFEKPDELKAFPVIAEISVLWGHMDAYGVVNNVYYFRFFETSRFKYFYDIGFEDYKNRHGIGPILATTKCDFLESLTFPDIVLVGCRTKSIGNTSFLTEHKIYSTTKKKIVASGEGVVVSYDYSTKKKAPLPQEIRAAIEKIESKMDK